MLDIHVMHQSFPIDGSFTISRGTKTSVDVVVVVLKEKIAGQEFCGWGECVPYARYAESVESVMQQISDLKTSIRNGITRVALQDALPAGAARNALDCALWDLEAKKTGCPVWQLAGLQNPPKILTTAYTLSLDTPDNMAANARKNSTRSLFKMKLSGEGDMERVRAVRRATPHARLIVDANEGWQEDRVERWLTELAACGVEMVEQPLPSGQDHILATILHPIPVCADESVHDCKSLKSLEGKYDMINIKMDKTGGLSEALRLKAMAVKAGLRVMVGSMLATSLAMAPATLVAQDAEIVDLDGPLLLAKDRDPAIGYDDMGHMMPPPSALWG